MIDVDRCDLLTAEEERDLARRIAGGDAGARDRLVRCNESLAWMFARRRWKPGRGLAVEDLAQAGMMGLVQAADRYDGRGRFSTYARWHVENEIRKAVREDRGPIRIKANALGLHSLLANGKIRRSDLTPGQSDRVDAAERVLSATVVPGSGGSLREHAAPEPAEPEVDLELLPLMMGRILEEDREVIEDIFGVGRDGPTMLRVVAERQGVSTQTIRKRMARGMGRLREMAAERGARP